MKMTGIELIAKEREEQITKHGRSIERDVQENNNEQLSLGALMLLNANYEEIDSAAYPEGWSEDICAKMVGKSYEERLIIAGALIVAELDRLQAVKQQ